jgi:phosphosulfolactate phosphohydrolase-like enzyme
MSALRGEPANDAAVMALRLFESCREDLRSSLAATRGGQNVINAKLDEDLDFAARLDALDVVGVASGEPLVVRRLT